MIRLFALIILLQIKLVSYAQKVMVLRIADEQNEQLEGATVTASNGQFLITNQQGEVTIRCSCDSVIVNVQHVGYQRFQGSIPVVSRHSISMVLEERLMEDVVISADSEQDKLEQTSGLISFKLESKSHLPYLLGERDPIKFIQTQTGVSTGTDGNNGYYVRGGGIDQNAIELDHMEFYNTNHLFGFFSTFSAASVDRAEFMKGGYPAHVGGRLSSTLSLHTVSPDIQNFQGSFSVGVLAANLHLETPVIKDRSGLMVSYRRSYFDLITQNFLSEESGLRRSTNYRFSDMIIKYEHQVNEKNTISFTGFTGGDFNDFQSSRTFANQIDWTTSNVGITWNSLINEGTDFEFYFNAGHFTQNFRADISSFGIALNSDITNWKTGILLFHDMKHHELTFGANWVNRRFKPNQVSINISDEASTLDEATYIYTSEWSGSVDDYWQVSERLRVGLGLRVSGSIQWGPFDRYLSENAEVYDTLSFDPREVVNSYIGLEPRFRVNYLLDKSTSLKFSYDRSYQYIHLSPLSSVSLPTDLWVPSTSRIKPQSAHQLSLGYFKLMKAYQVNYSVEAFGKLLNNQMEWRNGAIAGYSDSPNLDDDFIFGRGHSYGLELSLSRTGEVFKGELNYTISRTWRRFEEVNQGRLFPAKYDRIHDLSVVGSAFLGKWTLSGLFKLASGTALTLPTAKYLIGERVISEYSERNGLRMPIYHRMDLSAMLVPEKHPNVNWTFSIYNVYNRNNPYFMYFDVQGSVEDYSLDVDLEEVSLFPVLPSISYQLNF